MLGDVREFVGKEDDAACRTKAGAQTQEPKMRAVVGFKPCCVVQTDRDFTSGGELDKPISDITLPDLLKCRLELPLRFRPWQLVNFDGLISDTSAVPFRIRNESLNAISEGFTFLGSLGPINHTACDLCIDGQCLR